MMILAFAVTIVALSFGLLNDSGEYLSVEGDSAAFFAHLVAQIWNCWSGGDSAISRENVTVENGKARSGYGLKSKRDADPG